MWAWAIERVKDQDEFITQLDAPLPNESATSKRVTPVTQAENVSAWTSAIGG